MSLKHPTVREFLSHPDSEIEERFFARVMLPNKTFKTTSANRLDDLNAFSMPHIASLQAPLAIMDVAVSSGISTAEWAASLADASIACSVIGTDSLVDATLVSLAPGFEVLIDDQRHLLHVDLGGYGFSSDLRLHSNAYLLPVKLAAIAVYKLIGRTRTGPSVRMISRVVNGLPIVKDDISASTPLEWLERFDVVRAANILNRSYFKVPTLIAILRNLSARMKQGGLLIVSRTTEKGTNDATIFCKRDDCLVVIDRLGTGSEVEWLAKEYTPASGQQ